MVKIGKRVVVPRSMGRDFAYLKEFADTLTDLVGWDGELTSFYRPNAPSHKFGMAVDIAFRQGPLWRDRRRGNVVYYLNRQLWRRLRNALRVIGSSYPGIALVAAEADHLHVEATPDQTRGRPMLVRYSPPKYSAITKTPGRIPWLRTERDAIDGPHSPRR